MTLDNSEPRLYWISGSPPAWRVMLALSFKNIEYISDRLSAEKAEHKTSDYLKINPRGQVPTLVCGDIIVRESIAILAFLDRMWPDRPIFGGDLQETAEIWQWVMDIDANLHSHAKTFARIMFRDQHLQFPEDLAHASTGITQELDTINNHLSSADFLVGDKPSAADFVLYPTLAWIERASARTENLLTNYLFDLDKIKTFKAWKIRIEELPGFDQAYPPHWK